MPQLSAADLEDALVAFRERVALTRRTINPDRFAWYPYDSLSNVGHLSALLRGTDLTLGSLLDSGTLLDIGCGDGDLAFFFESLGANVIAMDHPGPNHNGMRGVRALKDALQSDVDIREIDLDGAWDLHVKGLGLVCMLGVLYHLKNPLQVLEQLARRARYCLISTRIASHLPDRNTRISHLPVAYLVDEFELNGDNSNFWIFTETSLRRLVGRAQWKIRAMQSFGATELSDPTSLDRDERAFLLLESRYGVIEDVELFSGWHTPEQSGWRWTEKHFSARVRAPLHGTPSLKLDMYIPDALVDRFGTITLSARV